ncbi:MAG: porin, partial [Flavobacteriales bacterium]|nr:porin [Flavobacteriales bacterium]
INRPFTLDRQQGMQIYGRFDGGGLADINYWVSALTGTGRGARENNDLELMYVARLQWNFLGEDVEMSGCDLERTRRPSAIIALAGAMNRSPYTRFAQSGGGDLEGFAGGDTSLYDVRQVVVESAFKYKGFSWQHESHWKHVEDVHIGGSRDLVGSYMQVGYFPHGGLNWMPSELEVAGRFAIYRPDVDIPDNLEHEYSVAVNWFFKAGHKNKLTAEYGYIAFQQKGVPYNQGSRLRVQWDISF